MVEVSNGRKREADDVLGGFHHLLQSLFSIAVDHNVEQEGFFHICRKYRLCFFDQFGGVQRPREILRYVDTEKLEDHNAVLGLLGVDGKVWQHCWTSSLLIFCHVVSSSNFMRKLEPSHTHEHSHEGNTAKG